MQVTFDLPMPPSVNNLHINIGRKRTTSPKYRAWQVDAGEMLRRQNPQPFGNRAIVVIDLDDRRNGDADNYAKACVDLLVRHGVLVNDTKKYVQRVSSGWESVEGCRVTLRAAA